MRRTPIDFPDPSPADLERFLAKCRHINTCVVWLGKTPRFAYSGVVVRPARLFWKLVYGSIPQTENLLPTCLTPGCLRHRSLTKDAYAI